MENSDFSKALDQLSSDVARAPQDLRNNVLARISPKDDVWSWFRVSLWRPVYASALPLLLGFLLGMNSSEDSIDPGLDDLLLADTQIEFVFDELERDSYE